MMYSDGTCEDCGEEEVRVYTVEDKGILRKLCGQCMYRDDEDGEDEEEDSF